MNKKLVATAVGSTIGVAMALPVAAHDNHLLIPYVVKDSNRTTVVTLISEVGNFAASPSRATAQAADTSTVHLQYWTKSTTDANTAACAPSSVFVPVTDNDVVTFDTAGILGYPLFGDSTNPAPLGTAISYAAPRHGYLVVEWPYGPQTWGFGLGYWMELDLANGGAHGDWALGDSLGVWEGQSQWSFDDANFGDFDAGQVLKSTDNWGYRGGHGFSFDRGVAFWPTSVASTAFTVTPLGSSMLTKENNQVIIQVQNSNDVQGAYDRNENGVDGTVPITVRCVGRVTPAQLMPGVVTNAAWAAQGGWGFLRNLGDNDGAGGYSNVCVYTYSDGGTVCKYGWMQQDAGDLDALVYQVDSSSVGGKFMVNATRLVSEQSSKSYESYFFDFSLGDEI